MIHKTGATESSGDGNGHVGLRHSRRLAVPGGGRSLTGMASRPSPWAGGLHRGRLHTHLESGKGVRRLGTQCTIPLLRNIQNVMIHIGREQIRGGRVLGSGPRGAARGDAASFRGDENVLAAGSGERGSPLGERQMPLRCSLLGSDVYITCTSPHFRRKEARRWGMNERQSREEPV